MSPPTNKNVFRTYKPLDLITGKLLLYLATIREIEANNVDKGIIGFLPNHNSIYINSFKIKDITRKHGLIPYENLILTANNPTFYVKGMIENREFMTLAKDFGSTCFVLSTRRYEEFYVVTFFEPASKKYLESIKKRGEVLYIL